MATLTNPTKRIHIEIVGGAFDGHWFDTKDGNPLERHFWAMLQGMTVGETLHSIALGKVLEVLQNRSVPKPGPLTETYKVIAREETDTEMLIQMQHSYLP
jgi:hypothetical protein